MFVNRFKDDDITIWSDEDLLQQAEFFCESLTDMGYIKSQIKSGGALINITPKGYQRIDELLRNTGTGKNVFVAMSFADGTMKLREAIKQGIQDAGYNPVLIDEVEHNELITPEMLSYIKNSKFVVVDLSHRNNGAYFEEGYAMGLGKEVIQLCKKDTNLHFDVAQKNTIIWENESDIPLKLKNRIKATIE